ncbi:MFS transporter [Sphaerisporangium corydalis]|uniref:MFS transporter n=1 Tax=Sphaerisporangium corydalis TaxID=1441875 RepID=A0ABV9EC22_9ACTN|nr:MFS transporter [Sphaerisporangium corydalis]
MDSDQAHATRHFPLLWFGQGASRFGTAITTVVMPLAAVTVLGTGTFLVTAIQAAVWLPWLVIGLPAGAWVDRLPRRATMLVCDLTSALTLATVPLAAWTGTLTVAHLVAVALVLGTVAVFFSTAGRAFLPDIVPAERLPGANARLQGTDAGAQILGPAAGGLVAQFSGAVTGLLIDALTFLVSASCLRAIRVPEPRFAAREKRTTTFRAEIADGLRFVFRDPYLRVFTVHAGASNLAASALQAILIVFLVRTVGLSESVVGVVVGAAGIGGVAGALVVTGLAGRIGSARTILILELGATPFALLIPLTTTGFGLVYLMAGGLTVSVAIVASNVLIGSFTQSYCPPHLLGRVSASLHFVNFSTLPLGALMGGFLAEVAGLRATMWVVASLAVASSLILLAGPIRKTRSLPSRATDAVH